jgi:hypothetical protein
MMGDSFAVNELRANTVTARTRIILQTSAPPLAPDTGKMRLFSPSGLAFGIRYPSRTAQIDFPATGANYSYTFPLSPLGSIELLDIDSAQTVTNSAFDATTIAAAKTLISSTGTVIVGASTPGAYGGILRTTDAGHATWQGLSTIMGTTSVFAARNSMDYAFANNAGATYANALNSSGAESYIYFPGTTLCTLKEVDVDITASNPGFGFRVYDVTNSTVICEITSLGTGIRAITSIANLPTGGALWQAQIKMGSHVGLAFIWD